MARAQLAALACAGLLVGLHQPLGAVALGAGSGPGSGTGLGAELRAGLDCWSDASRDVRARLDLVMSVGERFGDPGAFSARAVPPGLVQPRPAWLDCFD